MSLGSTRKTSTLLAAFGAGALALGAATPLSAQQAVASNEGSPACAKYANDRSVRGAAADVQCEYNESVKRTKEHERRGAASDVRADAASVQATVSQSRTTCIESIEAGVKTGKFNIEAVRTAFAGKTIRDADVCAILGQLSKS